MQDDPFGLPPVRNDLQAQADRLRQKTAPQQHGDRKAPEENGVRLATINRSEDEELRLAWSEYNGRHFLNIRVWNRRDNGWWPDKTKGMTVRVRELPDFADGIAKALAI